VECALVQPTSCRTVVDVDMLFTKYGIFGERCTVMKMYNNLTYVDIALVRWRHLCDLWL